MEENHDEIAAMFEAELRDLDYNEKSEDEYDESLAQIDALGAQLRETLYQGDENDDDAEWQNMMNMRKANARFQILEETVSGDWSSTEKKGSPSSPTESKTRKEKKKKKKKKARSRSTSRSPSPARSPSPTQSASQKKERMGEIIPVSEIKDTEGEKEKEDEEETEREKQARDVTGGKEEEKESAISSAASMVQSGVETDPDKIVRDLMETIVNAVSSVAAMSVRPAQELSGPVTVDMSHLPQLFTADNEEELEKKQVRFASTIDKEVYEQRAAILDEAANESEKAKVQAAMDLLYMAEEKLEEEAEEERRLLERDREQRLKRKQRMAEEILRAKRGKAATSIEALARRILAKARCARLRLERNEEERLRLVAEEEEIKRQLQLQQEEEERIAAEKRAEEDRKFTIAENRKARQECELMLDADLEMMAFVNEERMLAERERDLMASQEDAGLFLRMDPGGAFESQQDAIKEAWAERNVEEDPQDWAVYEDGEDLHDEGEEESHSFMEEEDVGEEQQRPQQEKGEGTVKAVPKPNESTAVPTAEQEPPSPPLPPPSSRSSWRVLQSVHADRLSPANKAASDHFRRSLVSACMVQATKMASFNDEGAAVARNSLAPRHILTLRSSPPPAEQPPIGVTPSPRAKMGIRLASSTRPSPGLIQVEGASLGQWAEVVQSKCVFTQRLPSTGREGGDVGLPEEMLEYTTTTHNQQSPSSMCALSASLHAWKAWYTYVEQTVDEARARYAADAEMEGKYSNSTTLMGDVPPLNEDEQEALNALDVRRDPGKVMQLELKVEGLTSASFLRVYPHITSLVLNVNRLRSLDGLQHLQSLEHLEAKDNALVDISALANTTELRFVSLDDNQVADLSALSLHQGLQRLTVNNNSLKTLHSLVGCNFPKLQRLEVYQNSLVNVPEGALRGLTCLTYLDLGRNRLEWISGDTLSQCIHLQTLVLSQNQLGELPSPLRLPFLQVLWLSNNQLKSLDAWVPSENALIIAAYGQEEVEDRSRAPTAPFPFFCPMLEKLHLQDNGIQRVHEGALLLCGALKEVDLSFNVLTSCEDLVGLAMCPELVLLQLQENPLTTSTSVGTKDGLLRWLLLNLPSIGNFGDVDLSNEEVRAHFASAVKEARMARVSSTSGIGENGLPLDGTPVHERIRRYLGLYRSTETDSLSPTGLPFDPDLLELLSLMQLELKAVKTREKLRKRQVDMTVKNGTSREDAEASIGAGEEAHADGLLQQYSQRLLAWPGLLDGWLPLVRLTDRLNTVQENLVRQYQPWDGSLKDRCRGKNLLQKHTLSAMLLQALARGFISRRRLAKALIVSEYKDDELDFLVSGVRPFEGSDTNNGGGGGSGGMDVMEESFDLDEFLSEGIDIPELDQEYFSHAKHKPKSKPADETETEAEDQAGADKGTSATATEATLARPPMVYGDHRSHKKAQRLLQESQKQRQEKEIVPIGVGEEARDEERAGSVDSADSLILDGAAAHASARRAGSPRAVEELSSARPMFAPGTASSSLQPASWADNGVHLKPIDKDQASLAEGLHGASPDGRARQSMDSAQTSSSYNPDGYEQDLDRPMSAMTDTSDHGGVGSTPRSRHGADASVMSYADMAVSGGGAPFNKPGGLHMPAGAAYSRKPHQQQDQLAQEWGIKDPKVLAMMVKRSRKLQQSQAGSASMRGSTRSGGGGTGASGMSAKVKAGGTGSFGGKPKTTKGTNKTAGRKGVPPAWASPDN